MILVAYLEKISAIGAIPFEQFKFFLTGDARARFPAEFGAPKAVF